MGNESFEAIFGLARSLNRYVQPGAAWDKPRQTGERLKPGDDFNLRANWLDVLEPHGWRVEFERGGVCYWRRPGKDVEGHSATTGYCRVDGRDLMYVFSTNAAPFESERTYSRFAVYTLLNHKGDYQAAAAALGKAGWGEQSEPLGKIILNGVPTARPNADTSNDPLDADATAFDLILANSYIRWAWEKWLPLGVLTILASEPGVGKTRFCADLARRVYFGLPWPDGQPATFPAGSCSLWVPADNQHPELGTLPQAFGFPPNVLYLNSTKRNPFAGTMLDGSEDLKDFEARIKRVHPALVFIDTCLNATDRTSHKPEDAKAFFKPLQEIAARTGCVMACVTHLNAAGKPLGRRIEGQGRIVLMLAAADPEKEPNRRRLWVKKSNSMFPPPLGMTMDANGNEYDNNPPEIGEPDGSGRSRSTTKIESARNWLQTHLATGPKRVSNTRTEAELVKINTRALYNAVAVLSVEEFLQEGKKWWRLPADSP